MFAIVGIVVVFGAVVGGYLLEKGNILVLLQPAELVIIAGAALGTVLISNRPHTLKKIVQGIAGVFAGAGFSTQHYLNSLKMLYELFSRARRDGLAGVEGDIEKPEESKLFSAYPAIIKDEGVRAFICDTLRTAASSVVDPFDLDQMMELDMEVRHHDATQPVSALSTWPTHCPASVLWRPFWEWSLRWALWGGRRKRSATKWRPRWWAHFSVSCCAMAWWAP